VKRYVLIGIIALLLGACSSGGGQADAGAARFHFRQATSKGSVIPIADRRYAPAVGGTLIDGGSWALSEHLGHVVVINYWASWCSPCRIESPNLDQAFRDTRSAGIDFVGIDVKDSRDAARVFIRDYHLSYPMIFDEPGQTAVRLQLPVQGLPLTLLVDRSGRVAGVYIGAVTYLDVAPTVTKLAAET
jgi:thiol-disulfide isomerase/thioredoxin